MQGLPISPVENSCCQSLFNDPGKNRYVVSLAVVDPKHEKTFLFEATPDISRQLKMLKKAVPWEGSELPDGIFLTPMRTLGHYAGLMYLGKEGANANGVPVYAMPKMKSFLMSNGPWGQTGHQP